MARRSGPGGRFMPWLVMLALAAPVLVFVAAFATRFGIVSEQTGYALLTLQVGWGLAFVGAAAALLAVVLAVRDPRRLGLLAAVAVVAAGATLGGYVFQRDRFASGGPEDASSDLAERPGFSERLRAERGGQGPTAFIGPEACPGLRPVMTQVAPETAAAALRSAGFIVRGAGVGRADGTSEGFWFGFTHDAVIRIRPGRTDVRVAARDPWPHGGEACRLAVGVVQALEAAR